MQLPYFLYNLLPSEIILLSITNNFHTNISQSNILELLIHFFMITTTFSNQCWVGSQTINQSSLKVFTNDICFCSVRKIFIVYFIVNDIYVSLSYSRDDDIPTSIIFILSSSPSNSPSMHLSLLEELYSSKSQLLSYQK